MPIISVRDIENNKWKRNAKKQKNNKLKQRQRNYSERVRAKWFCCAF